ncbi:GNAT family N-acetyltransferase [Pontibacter pamirensis]|uniref:GNAT family N-acetyltransferase n=1 Tax=Pontibacter pamirensis TaxID=2562824 RepID=UPI0013896D0C|nr:GNAT family N-acetyltransferase [Pontibacter pamirensis]
MKIRKGQEADLPAVVDLLKASLGDSLVPKSVELWKWKHVDNPHGASPVLVAEEDGRIVGVRAFLKWQWLHNGVQHEAVRAVDTSTHPDFQGKGIFKKLTLQSVEDAKAAGVSFVYNTPNENSKPGYLKMGWVEKGRMPLKLKINPLAYKNTKLPGIPAQDWEKLDELLPHLRNPVASSGRLHTVLSPEYIRWRYKDIPLFDNYFLTDYASYALFYRFKEHSFGLEFRILDLLTKPWDFDGAARAQLQDQLQDASKGCFLVSASGRQYELLRDTFPGMGLLPVVARGPIVTLRNLTLPEAAFKDLQNVNSWGYSIGDMELF